MKDNKNNEKPIFTDEEHLKNNNKADEPEAAGQPVSLTFILVGTLHFIASIPKKVFKAVCSVIKFVFSKAADLVKLIFRIVRWTILKIVAAVKKTILICKKIKNWIAAKMKARRDKLIKYNPLDGVPDSVVPDLGRIKLKAFPDECEAIIAAQAVMEYYSAADGKIKAMCESDDIYTDSEYQ